jgi:hypothetical protein
LVQHTKAGKTYQITIKYTKWPENIPNGRKIYPMAVKIVQYLPVQVPPNFTQIRIFGLPSGNLGQGPVFNFTPRGEM